MRGPTIHSRKFAILLAVTGFVTISTSGLYAESHIRASIGADVRPIAGADFYLGASDRGLGYWRHEVPAAPVHNVVSRDRRIGDENRRAHNETFYRDRLRSRQAEARMVHDRRDFRRNEHDRRGDRDRRI